MKTQLSFVSKEEAHKLIDESPGNNVLILTYNVETGMSDTGRHIKKKKSKKMVDHATVLVLAKNSPIATLNLHKHFFNDFHNYEREKIIKSIMLPIFPQLE